MQTISLLSLPEVLARLHTGSMQLEDLRKTDVILAFEPEEAFTAGPKVPAVVTRLNMKAPIVMEGLVHKNQCEAAALKTYYTLVRFLLEK